MKTKLFFLLSFVAVFTACSEDADESIPSLPTKLSVISYDFIQEETDVLEEIKTPLKEFYSPENRTDVAFPHTFSFDDKTGETSKLVLIESDLPESVNLEELRIRVPVIRNGGTISKDGAYTPLIFGKTLELDPLEHWLSKGNINVIVFPNTVVKFSTQIGGYKCTMTFKIVLQDAYNRYYYLKGKWTGEQLNTCYRSISDSKLDGVE